MTYGRLALVATAGMLGVGFWLALSTGNGFAAYRWWLLAPLPAWLAYTWFRDHTDRSPFDLGRDADADGAGDEVDRRVRQPPRAEAPPVDPLAPPEPFLPDCDPWP